MKLLPADELDHEQPTSSMQAKGRKGSLKLAAISTAHLSGGGSSSSSSGGSGHSSSSSSGSTSSDQDDQDSPPISPLRSPLFSPGASSHSSGWTFSQGSQPMSLSPLRDFDDEASNESSQSGSCNSKEDKASYNTKFAKYHLDTYRQHDRMRWNFDFGHNRPLDGDQHHNHHHGHHGHHQAAPRYQWEPAI